MKLKRLVRTGYWAGIVSLGCHNASHSVSPGVQPEVVVTTDKSSYEAGYASGEGANTHYGFRVVVRTKNTGNRTLYVGVCYPSIRRVTYDVRMADGKSRSAFSPIWACVGGDNPPVLEPGAARVDTLTMFNPATVYADGRPYGTVTGKMNIHMDIRACREEGLCSLSNVAVSNTFDVQLKK